MLSDDLAPERAAVFEHTVERTAPASEDLRCRCEWCVYGERPRLTLPTGESAP